MKRVQLPDGRIAEFPADMGNDEIADVLSAQFPAPSAPAAQQQAPAMPQQAPSAPPQAPQAAQPMGWSDVGVQAVQNLIPSAGKFLGGVYDAVTSPVQTAGAVLDLGAGGLRNLGKMAFGEKGVEYLDSLVGGEKGKESAQRASSMASAAGEALKERYGSEEAWKKTLATDPVGFASDVSLLTGLGATLAPGKVGQVASTVSSVTNPMNAIVKPAGWAAGKVGAAPLTVPLGGMTGVGREAIEEAYKAGRAGGSASDDFANAMRGNTSSEQIVDAARQNLGEMKGAARASYLDDAKTWAGADAPVDFKRIDAALTKVENSYKHGGLWTVGEDVQRVVGKAGDIIAEWRARPDLHNVAGLDALKRRLGSIGFDKLNEPQAQRAVSTLYDTIKSEISQASHTYGSAMDKASGNIREIKGIERELSLGDKASVDTALRKLTSLTRNAANTNYGRRLELGRTLDAAGRNNIMPAVSGLAMNTWTPRGLQSVAGSASMIGGASLIHPNLLLTLPFQSPRLVGETARFAGATARRLSPVTGGLSAAGGMIRRGAPALAPAAALRELQDAVGGPGVRRESTRHAF